MTDHTPAAEAADQEIEAIMEQAQVFASAWAFLGGPFDNGSGLETAEREKANLRALLSKLRAPVADEPVAGQDRLLRAAATREAKDGIGALDALYDLAVKHGASKTAASGFAHVASGAFAMLEGQVHDEIRRRSLVARASAPAAGEAQPVGYIHPDTLAQLAFPMTPYREVPLYRVHRPHVEFDAKRPAGLVPIYTAPPAAPQASEAVRDALMAFDEAMSLCDDFPELQHHRDALLFAVQKARAALSAQPGAQKNGGSDA
ncbi:hypothetical protein [Achromobacter sp. NFACC18-2]|uniref:hypothetical protein n=1 Tax=Achromobacter sp. NFACC18-2 TaxID=1564112 RepID=UPI0008B360ED|nr:hypothetical protein [Achromobacter sp. NFACC18-2]SEK10472.1 hypothetical protein SAMN03159494_05301 [Achromobacter sp. NFACC18-2]